VPNDGVVGWKTVCCYSEKSCGHPATKRGMCSKHYKAHKQRKEAEKEVRELLDDSNDVGAMCSEQRCLEGAVKRGLCSKHYKECKAARKTAKEVSAKASEGSARSSKEKSVVGRAACTVPGCLKTTSSGTRMCRTHADASAASVPPPAERREPAVVPRTTRSASVSASKAFAASEPSAASTSASASAAAALASILPSDDLSSNPVAVFHTLASALGLDVDSMPPHVAAAAVESLNREDPVKFLQHLASAASVSQCSTSGNAVILHVRAMSSPSHGLPPSDLRFVFWHLSRYANGRAMSLGR
jgi:hypothetical protein